MNIIDDLYAIAPVHLVQVERAGWYGGHPPSKKWAVWAYWGSGLGHRLSLHRWKWSARLYAIGYREMFRQRREADRA